MTTPGAFYEAVRCAIDELYVEQPDVALAAGERFYDLLSEAELDQDVAIARDKLEVELRSIEGVVS